MVQEAIFRTGKLLSESFTKLDFSKAEYFYASFDQAIIEVRIPFKNSSKSYLKLMFERNIQPKIEAMMNKLQQKEDPFALFKKDLNNLGISEKELKFQIIQEMENGVIVKHENRIKTNVIYERFNFITNAA